MTSTRDAHPETAAASQVLAGARLGGVRREVVHIGVYLRSTPRAPRAVSGRGVSFFWPSYAAPLVSQPHGPSALVGPVNML